VSFLQKQRKKPQKPKNKNKQKKKPKNTHTLHWILRIFHVNIGPDDVVLFETVLLPNEGHLPAPKLFFFFSKKNSRIERRKMLLLLLCLALCSAQVDNAFVRAPVPRAAPLNLNDDRAILSSMQDIQKLTDAEYDELAKLSKW
jgi:hypothetical protein